MLIDYIKALTLDIQEPDFNKQLIRDSISPAWVLGHLCLETVRTADWIDIEIDLEPQWKEYFAQGKSPKNVPLGISKSLLISEFERIYLEFIDKLTDVPESILNRENPTKILKDYFPLVQHDVAHTLTSHLAIHGGQLGMWRKEYGLENKYGRK